MGRSKIIVCERDPLLRAMLVEFLNEQGYLAYGVNTIERCVDVLSYTTPNLLLLDSDIGESPESSAKKIREVSKAIPIVLMNGLNGALTQQQAQEDGATTLVSKPFRLNEMVRMIVELMLSQKVKSIQN